jgi:hypothetical protein
LPDKKQGAEKACAIAAENDHGPPIGRDGFGHGDPPLAEKSPDLPRNRLSGVCGDQATGETAPVNRLSEIAGGDDLMDEDAVLALWHSVPVHFQKCMLAMVEAGNAAGRRPIDGRILAAMRMASPDCRKLVVALLQQAAEQQTVKAPTDDGGL